MKEVVGHELHVPSGNSSKSVAGSLWTCVVSPVSRRLEGTGRLQEVFGHGLRVPSLVGWEARVLQWVHASRIETCPNSPYDSLQC